MTDRLRDTEEQNARLWAEVELLRERVQELEAHLAALRQRHERLKQRRVVRLGLAFADLWARTLGKKRRVAVDTGAPAEPRRTTEEVVAKLLGLRPKAHLESGPLVKIIVLTRNGYHHLERLFSGLDSSTHYRSFEVVVVDNNSTDGTKELFERSWDFPLNVISNPTNVSFSEGCNQGAEGSSAPLLLFLNNDIEPITPHWLGAMVSALQDDESSMAACAVLVYPEEGQRNPLTVQHRGIGFRHRDGVPLPYNLAGDDPVSEELLGTWPVPAATAACMLVRAEAFRKLGGFDPGYVYGLEDVDLCLRVQEAGGSVLLVGDAVLFHHESATQSQSDRIPVGARRRGNQVRFVERWAPTLSRRIKLEAASGHGGWWAPHLRRTVAITLTEDNPSAGWGDWYTAHELGDALEQEGWEVVYAEARDEGWFEIPAHVSLVISLLDRFDVRRAPADSVTVAWVRNWTDRWTQREWFSHYDVVLPSSKVSSRLVLEEGATPPAVVPLATNPARFHPRPEELSYRCDYTFTGHFWGVSRPLIDHLDIAPNETFTIYGKGWGDVPEMARYWRGPLPYDELPQLYNSTKIVLDDTAGPTLPYGAVNSRVFDALACGTLVISNNEKGSKDLFQGLLPTYRTREDLRQLLDRFLADESSRRETANRLREIVVDSHTYHHRAREIPDLAKETLEMPRISIKIGPPNHQTAEKWGDTHFARAFAKSLRRHRWRTRTDILPEWDQPDRQTADVALHIRGLRTYVPKPGHVNVLWIISHPDDVTPEECSRFDLVFVASESFARELREMVQVPVHVLLQATDPDRFHPVEPNPELATEVLFVGNSRRQQRPIVQAAIAAGLPLAIYGSDWEGLVPSEYVRDEFFPNERLAELYASAKVVLNDHWPDMAAKGFISNRVFDILASGAALITDVGFPPGEEGQLPIHIFDPSVDFGHTMADATATPRDQRLAVAHQVAERHSFDRRAADFIEVLSEIKKQRVYPSFVR